ncbi:hypothetical protein LWI28_026428 [Acer negundo]|uniref:Uncharacterized protein n=1 Tax=Acer negundo TaxID=4023 RepID=A0AAD5P6I1_ACENE|nr:hypothetical protein LWI28_026428 [Acer negundo]
MSSTSISLQPIEELPPKLQEIIKLFHYVLEPKAKYQQLLKDESGKDSDSKVDASGKDSILKDEIQSQRLVVEEVRIRVRRVSSVNGGDSSREADSARGFTSDYSVLRWRGDRNPTFAEAVKGIYKEGGEGNVEKIGSHKQAVVDDNMVDA